jgi:hypothetical protein
VPCKAEQGITFIHATAIIAYTYKSTTALLHLNLHRGSAGVHGIFNQLLDHGKWALYNLSGLDLIGNIGRENDDLRHNRNLGGENPSVYRDPQQI